MKEINQEQRKRNLIRIFFVVSLVSLAISILLNLGLGLFVFVVSSFDQRVPERIGVLKENIYIGISGEQKPLLLLPKGLTVKDVSPANQIDLFEPHRFSIEISSERELVDYDALPNNRWNDLYSADGFTQGGETAP